MLSEDGLFRGIGTKYSYCTVPCKRRTFLPQNWGLKEEVHLVHGKEFSLFQDCSCCSATKSMQMWGASCARNLHGKCLVLGGQTELMENQSLLCNMYLCPKLFRCFCFHCCELNFRDFLLAKDFITNPPSVHVLRNQNSFACDTTEQLVTICFWIITENSPCLDRSAREKNSLLLLLWVNSKVGSSPREEQSETETYVSKSLWPNTQLQTCNLWITCTCI